jgi:RNA-directed DNA polymerase
MVGNQDRYPARVGPLAEGMEGRRPTKENIEQTTASQTQSWVNASSGLLSVREAAKREGKTRFTALLHHVTVALLLESFYALKRDAAPGVDGVTWKEYETDLDKRLEDLHGRVHQGTYRHGVRGARIVGCPGNVSVRLSLGGSRVL